MLGLRLTTAYKKGYKRMKKRGMNMDLLDEVVDKLRRGETLGPEYDPHTLSGEFAGVCDCHIRPDWVLLYYVEGDISLHLFWLTQGRIKMCLKDDIKRRK